MRAEEGYIAAYVNVPLSPSLFALLPIHTSEYNFGLRKRTSWTVRLTRIEEGSFPIRVFERSVRSSTSRVFEGQSEKPTGQGTNSLTSGSDDRI